MEEWKDTSEKINIRIKIVVTSGQNTHFGLCVHQQKFKLNEYCLVILKIGMHSSCVTTTTK